MLARLAPDFRHEDVVDWTVQRAPLVEPVHALGHEPRVAPVWPGVDGLALASASQVYPRLLNGESIVRMAERVAAKSASVSIREPWSDHIPRRSRPRSSALPAGKRSPQQPPGLTPRRRPSTSTDAR